MSMYKKDGSALAPVGAGTKATPNTNEHTQELRQNQYSGNGFSLPLYQNMKETRPYQSISREQFIDLMLNPSVGEKDSAKLLTPYTAQGKKLEDALNAQFCSLVIDHDEDDLTRDQIKAIYDAYMVNYLTFTSSYHQQDKKGVTANRWKVLIPLSENIDYELYSKLSLGLTLRLNADKAQARIQQGFYAPNKLTDSAQYDTIICLDLAEFDPTSDSEALTHDALNAYEAHEAQQRETANSAPVKPRSVSGNDGRTIELVEQAYGQQLEAILQHYGNKPISGRFLSPHSQSGTAGIIILTDDKGKKRVYSHHGESDPLSNLNHDGHALDAFDVLCTLKFGGDVKKAIAHYANELDPQGQKERRREHMEKKNTITAEQFEQIKKQIPENSGDDELPNFPDELMYLDGYLGELQAFIYNRMAYPSIATAGIAAMATLSAFAQTNIGVKSRDGLGLNEYYMILAPTGFGKEDVRRPIKILDDLSKNVILNDTLNEGNLSHVNNEKVGFKFAAPSSQQGLHKIIEDNRSAFFLSDEFAEWLRMSHNEGHKQQALGYFMQLYTSAYTTVEPGNAVTTKYEQVKHPRIGVLATSTAEAMLETMTRQQADSGAYNRWVIFVGEQKLPKKRYEGLIYEPNEELVEFIAWVKAQKGVKIPFSRDGWATYKQVDSEIAEPIKATDNALGGRLGEQAIKMAALFALSDKRLTIEPQDLQKAFSIRSGLYKRAAALADKEGSLSDSHVTSKAYKQLEKRAMKQSTLYRSQLDKYSRQYAKLSIGEQSSVLNMLQNNGVLQRVEGKPKILASLLCSEQ
jgi:hypothetical protein